MASAASIAPACTYLHKGRSALHCFHFFFFGCRASPPRKNLIPKHVPWGPATNPGIIGYDAGCETKKRPVWTVTTPLVKRATSRFIFRRTTFSKFAIRPVSHFEILLNLKRVAIPDDGADFLHRGELGGWSAHRRGFGLKPSLARTHFFCFFFEIGHLHFFSGKKPQTTRNLIVTVIVEVIVSTVFVKRGFKRGFQHEKTSENRFIISFSKTKSRDSERIGNEWRKRRAGMESTQVAPAAHHDVQFCKPLS